MVIEFGAHLQLEITSNYNFTQIKITHTSLPSLLQPPISLPGYNLLTWGIPHALKASKLPQICSGYTALVQTAYKNIHSHNSSTVALPLSQQ